MSIVEIDYEKLIEYIKKNSIYTKDNLINIELDIFPKIKDWLNVNGYHGVEITKIADVIYDLGELTGEIEYSRTMHTCPIDIENLMRIIQKCDKIIMISTVKQENSIFE